MHRMAIHNYSVEIEKLRLETWVFISILEIGGDRAMIPERPGTFLSFQPSIRKSGIRYAAIRPTSLGKHQIPGQLD